jgi:hypothetical protein
MNKLILNRLKKSFDTATLDTENNHTYNVDITSLTFEKVALTDENMVPTEFNVNIRMSYKIILNSDGLNRNENFNIYTTISNENIITFNNNEICINIKYFNDNVLYLLPNFVRRHVKLNGKNGIFKIKLSTNGINNFIKWHQDSYNTQTAL